MYSDISSASPNDRTNLNYYQLLSNPNTKVLLSNFSQYNWNHVSIEFNSLAKSFKLVVNFNYFTPEILLENITSSSIMNFTRLIFCANNKNCNITPMAYLMNSGEKFVWGSAFYKNLNIDDSLTSNSLINQERNLFK